MFSNLRILTGYTSKERYKIIQDTGRKVTFSNIFPFAFVIPFLEIF